MPVKRLAIANNTPLVALPVPLVNPQRVLAYTGLDQGEAEVLALVEERIARLVIIDEHKGAVTPGCVPKFWHVLVGANCIRP